jgi:MerR family transcriptional regulator, light-induced transcriptional regulator
MAFTIKELESLSGIKAHTIRIWEQRYGFLKPSRTQTNIRTYNNEELKTILTVALLNKYGYKISRIDEMQPLQRNEMVMQLPQQEAYTENLVNVLLGHMIDFKNNDFEEVLNNYIREYGPERTITTIIFSFLEKTGILWQTNKIIPVQEHIVSNIIRQKLVSAIDALPFIISESPLFILLLPEGEHHELGLLFVYYLLKKNGLPVLYLGCDVPSKDVRHLFKIKSPQYLYLHLTTLPRGQSLTKYFSQLAGESHDVNILVSGNIARSQSQISLPNVRFFHSITEVIEFIAGFNSATDH